MIRTCLNDMTNVIRIASPATAVLTKTPNRLWIDPQYSGLSFACPETKKADVLKPLLEGTHHAGLQMNLPSRSARIALSLVFRLAIEGIELTCLSNTANNTHASENRK